MKIAVINPNTTASMTATASIVAVERQGVLRVPNTALRFMPTQAAAAEDKTSVTGQLLPRFRSATPKTAGLDRRGAARQIWVLEQGEPRAIAVTTGMGVFKLVTAQQSPDIYQPSGGNMVYVFELAD